MHNSLCHDHHIEGEQLMVKSIFEKIEFSRSHKDHCYFFLMKLYDFFI